MALNTMEFKQQRLVNGQTELELNQVFNFVADGLAIIDKALEVTDTAAK